MTNQKTAALLPVSGYIELDCTNARFMTHYDVDKAHEVKSCHKCFRERKHRWKTTMVISKLKTSMVQTNKEWKTKENHTKN